MHICEKENLIHTNESLIHEFYSAFQKRDAQAMIACYHSEIVFNDSVFRNLRGEEAGYMWQMLCERGKDLVIEFKNVQADEQQGQADWDAFYTFGRTGNKVHNIIHAEFRFQDGKIIQHDDSFKFWRWSGQALGTMGKLLGWSSFLQKQVQKQSAATLADYISKQ